MTQNIRSKFKTLMRGDGRMEWMCEHGIGHTIAVPTNWPRPDKGKPDYRYIHGCDGCCEK